MIIARFDRIGRNHSVEPLILPGTFDDAEWDTLAELIYKYAAPKLVSRDVDVHIDDDHTGVITAGFHSAGTFTLTEEAADATLGS